MAADQETTSPKKYGQAERWIISAAGVIIIALVTYVGRGLTESVNKLNETVTSLTVNVTAITKELELTPPREILEAVNKVDRNQLTKDEVISIVSQNAPWVKEREEWLRWRKDLENQIRDLKDRIRDLEKE